eukprot:Hpha_TRINITY_DN15696_c1_g5::TRINITY_DN15696_c1_g5_i2::g.101475::m.101475/K07748/E1.1.1.170, NSDHL, ERG26; sterol-4alpha-carboxylate 3-dehydrogenase (decarboxylating)
MSATGAVALATGGVLLAEAIRTGARCAGAGASRARAELPVAVVGSFFTMIYFCLPTGAGIFAVAGLLYTLSWSNKRAAPEQRRKTFAQDGAYRTVQWRESNADCPKTGDMYLVIGAGFFGKRLVRRLVERGERVRVMDIAANPFGPDEQIEYFQGNALREADLEHAMTGVDCVFATFALLSYMHRLEFQWKAPYAVNVTGTERVIEVAKRVGVKRIVQTSSSHVAACPSTVQSVVDETAPYVTKERSHNHYSWTKALSEKAMLAANCEQLRTVSVRPCSGIFGPSDGTVLEQMRAPVVPMPYPGTVSDFVFVDNVVLAHLKADARLREDAPGVSGESFCISNDAPTTWEDLCLCVRRYTSFSSKLLVPLPCLQIYVICRMLEVVTWATKGKVSFGLFTPACLETAALEFSADTKKARQRLNYTPCWTLDEAVQQTVAEWENRADAKAVYDLTSPRASPDTTEESPMPVRTPSPDSDAITSEARSVSREVTPATPLASQ